MPWRFLAWMPWVTGVFLIFSPLGRRRAALIGALLRRCEKNGWSLPEAERKAMTNAETRVLRRYLKLSTRLKPLWIAGCGIGMLVLVCAIPVAIVTGPWEAASLPLAGLCGVGVYVMFSASLSRLHRAELAGLIRKASGDRPPDESSGSEADDL